MDVVTRNVSEYIKSKRINLSAMARDIGISYSALYASLIDNNKNREIRGKELLAVCDFLDVDPRDFAEEKEVV